ncbi:MAG: ISKra4 family transposase, partial [Gammaproteobacteria bacterium SHHR-1]
MSAKLLPFPSPDPMTDIRAHAHQYLDAWLDQLAPVCEQASPPTLRELSARFTATRGDLLGGCLKAFSEALHAHYRHQRQIDCPHCGKRLSRKRVDSKRINTLQGPLVLERPYFYCSCCKQGFHPLDQALELARGVHQYDIQEKLLRHSAELPYDLAAELVGDLVGLSLSNHVAHDTAVAVSAIADQETLIPDAADIQRRIDAAKTHPEDKPVLVAALDGAHEPTRPQAKRDEKRGPGKWREAKGVRLYLALADNRIEQLASWHQIQDAEAMRRDLERIAQRIPQDQVRIALLGDGAAWIWNTLTAVFPAGRPILDVYHCKEHLYAVAERLDEAADRATHWVEACLALLSEDRAETVIAGLRSRRAT